MIYEFKTVIEQWAARAAKQFGTPSYNIKTCTTRRCGLMQWRQASPKRRCLGHTGTRPNQGCYSKHKQGVATGPTTTTAWKPFWQKGHRRCRVENPIPKRDPNAMEVDRARVTTFGLLQMQENRALAQIAGSRLDLRALNL